MFQSGHTIAHQMENLSDDQVQPNGIDLTLGNLLRIQENDRGYIGKDGKEVADRVEVSKTEDGRYELDPGEYIVVYGETISIPENSVGFVFPRSTLVRNGCMLFTAVWDAGYTGKGEGLLKVWDEIVIEDGTRIGQIVIAQADDLEETYSGSYDNERI